MINVGNFDTEDIVDPNGRKWEKLFRFIKDISYPIGCPSGQIRTKLEPMGQKRSDRVDARGGGALTGLRLPISGNGRLQVE